MIDVNSIIEDGTYIDLDGIMWVRRENDKGCEKSYWLRGDTGVSYSASQFKDKVALDQVNRHNQAEVLERAGRSGAFGTRAQSTLLTMAQMIRQGSLKEFLDSNGCKW